MRFSQIVSETTTAGSIATVSSPLGATQTRGASIYGDQKVGSLFKGKKTNKPYANSLTEGKVKELSMDLSSGKDGMSEEEFKKKYGKSKAEMRKSMKEKPEPVKEARLEEEDKIIPVGKGKKLKTGLHGKGDEPKFKGLKAPFKSQGVFVTDKRGNKVCDCENEGLAQQVAKALTAFAIANEVKIQGAGVIAGGPQYEDKNPGEYDMEGDFAKNQLHTMRRMVDILEKRIGDNENLPEWVQMKLSQAQGMLVGVTDYLISEKERNAEQENDIEGITFEGAKVDRMVKHIAKSERKLGKSKDEAENIAWATANKRGMLDNKNKKK
jgi:hypothetical protein